VSVTDRSLCLLRLAVDRPFLLPPYRWDRPLFRMWDDRPGPAMLVYRTCSECGI